MKYNKTDINDSNINENNETALLLDENLDFNGSHSGMERQRRHFYSRKIRRFRKKRTLLLFFLITIIVIMIIFFKNKSETYDLKKIQRDIKKLNSIHFSEASKTFVVDATTNTTKVEEEKKPLRTLTESEIKKKIFNDDKYESLKYFGFYYCDEAEGPITIDLNFDDGSKTNLYTRLNKSQNSKDFVLYKYDKKLYNLLENKTPSKRSIICEIPQIASPENFVGYKLTCPKYYTLRIEDAYFGLHHENDKSCKIGKYVGKDKDEENEDENVVKDNKNSEEGTEIEEKEIEKIIEEEKEKIQEKHNKIEEFDENPERINIKRSLVKKDDDIQNPSTSTTEESINLINVLPPIYKPDGFSCDSYPRSYVKQNCEGKQSCTIKPIRSFFGVPCDLRNKHLEIQFHCEKEPIKQPRIAMVTFVNEVKVNSMYENGISELYQYAKIHGYDFYVDHVVYDTDREIYYMKTNTIIKYLMKFLEEKTYDWIFWVDCDVIITNPNIKLETFLPPMEKNDLHLIISSDNNGINAGIFFLRVHPWSLSYMNRSVSYAFTHQASFIYYSDQTSMNNVLFESNGSENEHFAIVPQKWFNMYVAETTPGYLLIHLAGVTIKDVRARHLRELILNNTRYYSKTSEEMRKEVEEFYQHPIQYELILND